MFERLEALADAIVDAMGQSRLTALVVITIAALVLLIPGQAELPLTERDEARYVMASKQMLESGNFIEPMNLDQPRWKKPVGIYWLQAAAAKLTGQGAPAALWIYRLPSLLGILGAALLTVWALRPILNARGAAVAGLVVGTSVVTVLEGNIAKTDAALLFTIVAAQGALIRCLTAQAAQPLGMQILFWIATSAGVLIKGPLILMVSFGMLALLMISERSMRPLRAINPLIGIPIFGILTAPWFIAIGFTTDWAFYAESIQEDLLGKVGNAAEGHSGSIGYYSATMWATFWPWMPLFLCAIPFLWTRRRAQAVVYLLAWALPFWITFELLSTKLPHYIMPILPAVGGLVGFWLTSDEHDFARPGRMRIPAALLSLVGGGILSVLIILGPLEIEGSIIPAAVVLGVLGAALTLGAAIALLVGRAGAYAVLALGAMAVLIPGLVSTTLPRLEALSPSETLAALHTKYDACADLPVVAAGYRELSIAFHAGSDMVRTDLAGAADWLATGPDGARTIVELREPGTEAALIEAAGTPIEQIEAITAINYNENGDRVPIALFARAGDPVLADCR
ncbi:MAG: glycosyltransferase family 39 protein [Pseudomonadota bacterium]